MDRPTPGDQIVVKLNISVPHMSCECEFGGLQKNEIVAVKI